ncbi:MAG: hypothetical protein ACTSXV_00035 [Alphaproteobacteria bacterium]
MKKIYILAGALLLLGCSGYQMNQERQNFERFKNIPVPKNSIMDDRDTAVTGSDDDWSGVISFAAPYKLNAVFDYYEKEMKVFGWKQLTFSKGDFHHSMIFTRANRIAQIQFEAHALDGTHVKFIVSPQVDGVQ